MLANATRICEAQVRHSVPSRRRACLSDGIADVPPEAFAHFLRSKAVCGGTARSAVGRAFVSQKR